MTFIAGFMAIAACRCQTALAQTTTYEPPYAGDDMASVVENGSTSIPVLNNDWAFMAQLIPSSVTVVQGPLNGTAVVDASTGNVTYTPNAGFIGNDSFKYVVYDSNGLESNVATVSITVTAMDYPPQIQGFGASRGTGYTWIFAGKVVDETPGGLTVTFGGLLAGSSVTTQADGSFTYSITLSPGQSGSVSAQTVDAAGLNSNVAQTYVVNN